MAESSWASWSNMACSTGRNPIIYHDPHIRCDDKGQWHISHKHLDEDIAWVRLIGGLGWHEEGNPKYEIPLKVGEGHHLVLISTPQLELIKSGDHIAAWTVESDQETAKYVADLLH